MAWADLAATRLISVSSRSSNRILFNNALAELTARPAVFCEVSPVNAALATAAAGVGVAAVPALACSAVRYPTLAALALGGPAASRSWCSSTPWPIPASPRLDSGRLTAARRNRAGPKKKAAHLHRRFHMRTAKYPPINKCDFWLS